jgi:hypothetical protein
MLELLGGLVGEEEVAFSFISIGEMSTMVTG